MKITNVLTVVLVAFCVCDRSANAQEDAALRFEIGAQFSSLSVTEPRSVSNDTRPGFGGRATFNFNDSVALESQVDFYPVEPRGFFGGYTGGRALQAVAGVKAGKRFDRFGIFGKARPGFVRFNDATVGYNRSVFAPDPTNPGQFPGGEVSFPRTGARTEFATDVGGVVEFYPSRRIVTRFDIGDTIIRYKARDIEFNNFSFDNTGTPITRVIETFRRPAITTHNFQFSAGVGFRF